MFFRRKKYIISIMKKKNINNTNKAKTKKRKNISLPMPIQKVVDAIA